MSNLHTDDTFMWENKLMGDMESAYDAHSNQDSVTVTDPLVWRITHQSGPPVSRKAAAAERYVDWTQGPDWATAWAMDDDGCAFWFENRPTLIEDESGATWGDEEEGLVEAAPSFLFPESHSRSSLCLRYSDENDGMTFAEKMGVNDYSLGEDVEKAFMDALDRVDNVHSPSHYRSGSIECIEAIEEALTEDEMRGYFKGNCLKYLWRERYKNGTEDLQKAYWYLGRLIDNLED